MVCRSTARQESNSRLVSCSEGQDLVAGISIARERPGMGCVVELRQWRRLRLFLIETRVVRLEELR